MHYLCGHSGYAQKRVNMSEANRKERVNMENSKVGVKQKNTKSLAIAQAYLSMESILNEAVDEMPNKI